MKEQEMSLIDRYIAEVGRHLPEKNRTDIAAEIRTMLEDMIEERGHQAEAADNRVVAEVLEQTGDPRLLAAKYAPPTRYLIGPAWYEGYVKVLQRVLLTALPVVTVVIFILTLTQNPLDFIGAIGEALGSAFSVGVQILFWVTLVFVLLERSDEVPYEAPRQKDQAWTVAQLPKLYRTRQISVAETLLNIASILFVLIWIALPYTLGRLRGDPIPVPFLHPDLWNFWLPLFFVIMGLTLVHEVFKLKIGNWTPALTATNVILGILSIIYIAALVITQEVVNPDFLALLDQAENSAKLREVARWSLGISAAVIAGTYIWGMVNSILLARRLQGKNEHGRIHVKNVVERRKIK
jgi:hypothetical protein